MGGGWWVGVGGFGGEFFGDGEAALGEGFAEGADGLSGFVDVDEVAVVEHGGLVGDLADEFGGVGDEEDGAAFSLELLDPFDAFALEGFVADRQHLVDDEDFGFDVDGDGEPESGVHAR